MSYVAISLAGGTYHLSESVKITPKNGGTVNSTLTIRSADTDKAVFNGAKKISGWKKFKNNIWMAPVPEAKSGNWNFNQLFVNGAQKTLARFPNEGFYTVTGFPDGGEEIDYHQTCKRFQFKVGDNNWDEWHKKGKDTHSVYADPMFVNPEQYDFTLQPGSLAFKLGFKNINMKEVRPRK